MLVHFNLYFCLVETGNFQASAEQFEDQLKGLLDRAEQTEQGGVGGEHLGGVGGAERPVRKRRKLLEVGEYNQAYDEVIIVDGFGIFYFFLFIVFFCALFFSDLRSWWWMREGMSQRRRWREEPMRMHSTRILTPRISAGEKKGYQQVESLSKGYQQVERKAKVSFPSF